MNLFRVLTHIPCTYSMLLLGLPVMTPSYSPLLVTAPIPRSYLRVQCSYSFFYTLLQYSALTPCSYSLHALLSQLLMSLMSALHRRENAKSIVAFAVETWNFMQENLEWNYRRKILWYASLNDKHLIKMFKKKDNYSQNWIPVLYMHDLSNQQPVQRRP